MSALAQSAGGQSQDALYAVYETETYGVPAWLVVHRLKDNLSFGGFRFSEGTSRDQVALLARSMSWKLAAHGLPVGGAKAGVCCRPGHPQIDAILADLARACPDRIRDLTGYVRDMTGLGAVIAAEAAVGSLQGKRLLIQGAGVVGMGVAVRAAARGAVVVGLSDVDRAILSPAGLPMAQQVLAAREAGQPFSMETLETVGGAWPPRDAGVVAALMGLTREFDRQLAEPVPGPLATAHATARAYLVYGVDAMPVAQALPALRALSGCQSAYRLLDQFLQRMPNLR